MIKKTQSTTLRSRPSDDKLGFGQYFTDHMFVSEYMKPAATTSVGAQTGSQGEGRDDGWDDGEIKPYGPFQMDPAASVLHYGQALFEGMKAFQQKDGQIAIFRPEFNADRLRQGAKRLCLPAPSKELFLNGVKELLKIDADWMPRVRGTAMYLRPTLIGTEAFLGVRPSEQALFYIILSPVGPYYKAGTGSVKIWIEKEDLRAAPGGLGSTKAGANYAASLRAAVRAREKGCAQVLWTDVTHETVEEVGTMNVFFVVGDKVLTPALNGSILEGGTRKSVLDLLQEKGMKVEERPVTLAELRQSYEKGELKEIFGTGTAAVITPVESLMSADETWSLQTGFGPVARYLYDQITGIQYGEIPDRHGWMKTI